MEKILSENNFIRKLILDNILISRATIFESIALVGRDFNSANVQRITNVRAARLGRFQFAIERRVSVYFIRYCLADIIRNFCF